jgi:hypothetical protein
VDCLRGSTLAIGVGKFGRDILTNNPPIALFSHGKDLSPSSVGSVFMTYNKVKNPGASMVIQAIFPGMLNRFVVDVFPAGYHFIAHWTSVIYKSL